MLVTNEAAVFQARAGGTLAMPERQQQVVLQPLHAVQEQHADHGERQHAAQVGAPLLVGLRVDADQPCRCRARPASACRVVKMWAM